VPQVKKDKLRDAILAAAFDLFCRKGYTGTTMAEIARSANMTVANLYVYFPSKLVLLYELYQPWLQRQMDELRDTVRKFRSPRARLRRIFLGIWSDIPGADHCFANTMIDALAAAPERTQKPSDLLVWAEETLTELIVEALPPDRRHLAEDRVVANIAWMAFDGFAVNRRIGDMREMEAVADRMVGLLLGADPPN
jgi:AcrR family transcriptional regulator